MAPDVRLIVEGKRYGGWKSARIVSTIESLSGAFDLEVTDRWSEQSEPWPIREEDECRVEIDGETVIDGYVGRVRASFTAEERTLTVSGKDRTAALVECSAVLDRWSFRNASVVDVARKMAEPFGVKVSVQPALEPTLPAPPRKMAVDPGDYAWDVIARAAESAGVLVVSDGAGGILITRAAARRAAPIVEGDNLLAGTKDGNAEERYRRYLIVTQTAGTDASSGDATRVRAEGIDDGVRRAHRVLLVEPAEGLTHARARQRADWEARIRAARAQAVTLTVQGWTQPGGALWPVNALTRVRAPSLGIDGDLLISQADRVINDAGTITMLSLVRPDAFSPETDARVKPSRGERWLVRRIVDAVGALAGTVHVGASKVTED